MTPAIAIGVAALIGYTAGFLTAARLRRREKQREAQAAAIGWIPTPTTPDGVPLPNWAPTPADLRKAHDLTQYVTLGDLPITGSTGRTAETEEAWLEDRYSPDCAQGKHTACSGDAWDHHLDTPALCLCECHPTPGARA